MGFILCLMLIFFLLKSCIRFLVLLVLIFGLLVAVFKLVVFVVFGVLWYIWYEFCCCGVVVFLCVLVLGWVVQGEGIIGVGDLWYYFSDVVIWRLDWIDNLIEEWIELIRIFLDHVVDVLLLGFGLVGIHVCVSVMINNIVHVYYLGVLLMGGLLVVLLFFSGMGLIVVGLWKHGQ